MSLTELDSRAKVFPLHESCKIYWKRSKAATAEIIISPKENKNSCFMGSYFCLCKKNKKNYKKVRNCS